MAEEKKLTKPLASKLPVEEIAKRRKMLPQFEQAPAQMRGGRVFFTPPKLNPEFWKFAAAKAYAGWNEGAELSEAEFDEMIAKATTERIG